MVRLFLRLLLQNAEFQLGPLRATGSAVFFFFLLLVLALLLFGDRLFDLLALLAGPP